MVTYNCPRCGYSTYLRPNFIKHLNRKNICKPLISDVSIETLKSNDVSKNVSIVSKNVSIVSIKSNKKVINVSINANTDTNYICKYCSKEYKHRSSKCRHEQYYCKNRNDTLNNNIEESTDIISDFYRREQEWTEERKELLGHINKLIDKTGTTINTTVNNKIQNNKIQNNKIQNNKTQNNFNDTHTQIENDTIKQPIKLRDFGDENMEHITHDFCKELLKEPYSGPNKLVRAIHFNPNYIENSNVQATNRKSNITAVVRNGKWEYMNKRTLLNREYIKTNKILDDCFDKEKNNLSVKCRELYENFKIARNDLHQYNNTLCNIFIEILNGTNEIKLLHSKNPKLLVC
jgi:hypothetical protein